MFHFYILAHFNLKRSEIDFILQLFFPSKSTF